MDNKRICPECSVSFPPTRSDQTFCGTTCRWKAWRKKKDQQKRKANNPALAPKTREKPLEGLIQTDNPQNPSLSLRGVIVKGQINKPLPEQSSGLPQEQTPAPAALQILKEVPQVKSEAPLTPIYKEMLAIKMQKDAFVTRVLTDISLCDGHLKDWEAEKERLQAASYFPSKRNSISNVDITALKQSSLCDNEFAKHLERQKKAEGHIASLRQLRMHLQEWLVRARKEAEQARLKLDKVPRYMLLLKSSPFLQLGLLAGIAEKKMQQEQAKPIEITAEEQQPSALAEPSESNEIKKKNSTDRTEVETNEDLISNEQLSEMQFHCLDFQSKWLDFFGQPAVVFHLAVHGRSGHGKSNFCFQYANYLAKNFGNTVYISGEEGFSKTLKDKKILNKVDSEHIYWCRYKNYEAIKSSLKNQFNFIFLDSLDTLGIDALKLRELRGLFPDSAFITISQSTKDGKMRGSNEILHDSDMAVKVENGIAITTKNRYKEAGSEYRVFPERKKQVDKPMDLHKGIL